MAAPRGPLVAALGRIPDRPARAGDAPPATRDERSGRRLDLAEG